MALKATIYKAELQISDMDRHHYQGHTLTIARHPSETDERMMVRLLAFALHADEDLSFTKGLSTNDEPELWKKDLTGAIELWIDIGHPDERRIRKACGRARQIIIYSYGGHATELWWAQVGNKLDRFANLSVVQLPQAQCRELTKLVGRNMRLQCTIQDGQLWIGDNDHSVSIEPHPLRRPH